MQHPSDVIFFFISVFSYICRKKIICKIVSNFFLLEPIHSRFDKELLQYVLSIKIISVVIYTWCGRDNCWSKAQRIWKIKNLPKLILWARTFRHTMYKEVNLIPGALFLAFLTSTSPTLTGYVDSPPDQFVFPKDNFPIYFPPAISVLWIKSKLWN